MFVQMLHALGQAREPLGRQRRSDALRMAIEDAAERLALDVFHDEPVIAALIGCAGRKDGRGERP